MSPDTVAVTKSRGSWLSDGFWTSPTTIWRVFWIAAASFLPTLFFQYEGEEGVYTTIAQEMRTNREFIVTTLHGMAYYRPGLFPWLILMLTSVLGWDLVLVAARLIAVTSTILTALTLAWLVRKVFADRLLAAVAAAVFLSGDVLLFRGWLAYADPLFAFFTFGAMACLWVATHEQRNGLLVVAMLALIGAFLTKVMTAYVFYGVLGLVLLWRHENRLFLFRPASVVLHAVAAAFPLFWSYGIVGAGHADVVARDVLYLALHPPSWIVYLKSFVLYPFDTILHLLPASGLAIFVLVSRKVQLVELRRGPIDIAVWATLVNVMPYWIVSYGNIRYLLPIFPLVALVMAYLIVRAGDHVVALITKLLVLNIVVALVVFIIGRPVYQHYVRGTYVERAQMIMARAGDQPIYAKDTTALGLSLVATLNTLRAPKPPITQPPPDFASGLVVAQEPDPAVGQIDLTFGVGRDTDGRRTRYLLCRGAACAASR